MFLSSASMWDVRNEYLYLATEAEGTFHDTYIAAFGKESKVLIGEAKKSSLKELKQQIIAIIKGVKD